MAGRFGDILGRVIRDIGRKVAGDALLGRFFEEALAFATRLYNQKKNDKNGVYSIHAPEVEYISKSKAHRKYESGNKASYATTSHEGFVIGALGCAWQFLRLPHPFRSHRTGNTLVCPLGKEYGDVGRRRKIYSEFIRKII
jgi:hypothetical protein